MADRFVGIWLFALSTAILAYECPAQNGQGDRSRTPVPVSAAGGVSASVTSYQASGIDGRRSPYTYALSGNVTIRAGEFALPITLNITEQSRDFTVPFRRYGVSPRWKWATVHLGYRSLTFSRHTVGGATFLGGGFELNPGLFRLGALYGRFQKTRQPDNELGLRPQYKRTGYGVRLGVGTRRSFFDVIFFRATDDEASLDALPENPEIRPKENVVLGVNTSAIPVSQLRLFGEAAMSALNRDVTAPTIDSTDVPKIFRSIFTPRESVQVNLAVRAGADLNLRQFGVMVEYVRVEPDYETLGSYYFNTDVESITLTPRVSLYQGRINLSVMGGVARNNLFGDLLETTRRVVTSATASVRASRNLSLSAQYGNFSTDQRAGFREVTDTTRVETVSRNFALSPRLRFASEAISHSFTVRFSQQEFTQVSELTLASLDAKSRTISGSYGLQLRESDLGIRVSATFLSSTVRDRESKSQGYNINVTKSFLDRRLSADARLGYRNRRVGDGEASGTLTGNLGISYSATRFDGVSLRVSYGGRLVDPVEDKRANEFLTTLTYSRRF